MSRHSTSSLGALHPVLFMLLVYIVSVVLAFFVCRMIYFSVYGSDEIASDVRIEKMTTLTAAK